MEMLIIVLIIILLYVGAYYIIKLFSKKKDNKVIKEKDKNIVNEEEKIIETKTIYYVKDNIEQKMTFNVSENNGGILKITKNDRTPQKVYYELANNNNTPATIILGTSGMTIGKYDSFINNNNLFILGREGMYRDYYIDINNISKIEENIYIKSYNDSLQDEYYDETDNMSRISINIYTKSKKSFNDLEYDISMHEDINKFLEFIQNVNNNITFEYKNMVYITSQNNNAIKYSLDNKLNIKLFTIYYNTKESYISDKVDYEFSIEYSDITAFELDKMCININTKNNGKFILFFDNNDEANKLYNSIKIQLK